MSTEMTQIINALCEKLGVAADILVPEMARYYIARLAFITLVETIFAIIVAIVFVRIPKWVLGETDADWYDWSDKLIMIFFLKNCFRECYWQCYSSLRSQIRLTSSDGSYLRQRQRSERSWD